MNEEPIEQSEEATDRVDGPRFNNKLIIGGAVIIAVLAVAVFGLLYLFGGGGGSPVAAPKDTDFSHTSNSTFSSLASDRKLTLTDDQLRSAGLEFTTIGETLDGVSAKSATAGVVKANEYESTPVNAFVGGVVREVYAELGQYVKKGSTIAVVYSDDLAEAESKYLSMKAELDEADKRYERALKLSDISEESRNELDRTTAGLRASEAMLAEKRSNFERSKKLVEIGAVSRKAHERVTTEFETAKANLVEAENRFGRAKKLLLIDPARNNELDQFLTKVRSMQADTAAARERLLVLGLPKSKVDSLRSPDQVSALLPIIAPISGTVTERDINRGEVVSANNKIATVTDLSTVWVIGQVYEKDLGKIRTGSGASVRSDSYPDELFRGTVSYIDPALDTKTRTAQVRVEISNPGEKLKIGMYVDVAFAMLGGSEKTVPLVPKEAVQTIGEKKVVFLATEDPKTFTLREVRLGEEQDSAFPVIEGVFVGDRVVTTGSFLLRAEWLKTNSESF